MRHTLTLILSTTALGLLLTACQESPESAQAPADDAPATDMGAAEAPAADGPERALNAVLMAQPAEVQARYQWRHPQETLNFFGIEPGMTVVEALPGGGWYSKILSAYLGAEGTLVGADYSLEMYPKFGFMDEEALAEKQSWAEEWVATASGWHEDGAAAMAFHLGSLPADLEGEADAVLFIRALHNMARFEGDGGFLSEAIADAYAALKPGGVVGVVQHRAPDDASDEWAGGARGYLKRDAVIASFENAGFTFEESSDINTNPADQPGEDDVVWRLPPTLAGSGDDPDAAAAMQAIGESNRMTLRFRKPA